MSRKVIFVANANPFLFGGGAQGVRCYLDAVLEVYGKENVVCMIAEEIEILPDYKDVQFVKVPRRTSFRKCYEYFQGFLSRFTLPLMNYVKSHSDEYSICIINGSLTGGKVVSFLQNLQLKVVMIYHNYEVEYHRDNKTTESLKGHYLGAIKKNEGYSFRTADVNVFVTQQDIALFRKAYGKERGHNYIVGDFDYKNKEVEIIGDVTKQYDITISGSLGNYQTTVGIKDFYSRYYRILKSIIPNLKVLLTGRSPSKEIQEIQEIEQNTITIVANPKYILPVVQQGNIYLCPTCIGGGLKLRAMDGLKCGMPVLAHEVSARGYDYYFDKPYYRIYYDETSFEAGLKDLIAYLENTPNSAEIINHDYYEYFGYEKGVKRMRVALKMINI